MYFVLDNETENHHKFKRFASPFIPENWVVARGWKKQGDKQCSWSYHPKPDGSSTHIPDDATIIVGHNLKFDLLYEWKSPSLRAFLKRGGRIWDTQYAEYLLEAMKPEYHMNSLDQIVEKYGGTKKLDAVKALWEDGWLTSEIDKDMLIDYLVGTKEEKRDAGDIGNTEKIFLGQIKRARELGMVNMIFARMDGLLCTTEMEYNGLHIDVAEAARRIKILEKELVEVEEELQGYLPELPEGLDFNWASNTHKSCIIFGGTIKYVKPARYIDPKTGKYARKIVKQDWPLVNGEPVRPSLMGDRVQDVFTSGKRKGDLKFKKVSLLGEFKTRKTDFFFELPGYAKANPEWQTKNTDGADKPIYQTNEDVIIELGALDIPFLKAMLRRQTIVKDLGTYYVRYDPGKKEYVGMLTCVMPGTHIIHHKLNHTNTVTSRLSSSDPNLQNVSTSAKSEAKKMFNSRFGKDGLMMETDYAQLEVVGQGVLSGDVNMKRDLRNKIDFHCKRVANKYGCTYEEAVYRCKDKLYHDHAVWKEYRRGCKEFSFQRAYGAGASAISLSTGMSVEVIKELIAADELMYPGVVIYNDNNEKQVKRSAVPFRDPSRGYRTFRRGYLQIPTGTMFSFRSYDAPEWLKTDEKDTFMPTEIKNYPIQGFCGEVVQIILGKLFRWFLANDNYGGLALLCNTVHDCVWTDCHNDVHVQVAKDTKRIMESVPQVLKQLYDMDVDVPFPVEVEIGKNLYDKEVIHV